MLRRVLVAFGWIIPIVVLFLAAIAQIYSDSLYRTGGGEYAQAPWISVVRNLSQAVQSLALSPLCFFGAHMLKKKSQS